MSHVMTEDVALQRQILLSKAERARQMDPGDKLMIGPRLFDQVCERMRDGIRTQHPDFDSSAVETELKRRLDLKRQLDERGFFVSAGVIDEQ